MIANYIKIILRQIGRQRLFAFINIAGLSIGLTGALLILLYLRYETSYDRFHPQAERICRVTRQYDTPTGYQRHFARVPENWINQLPDEFPDIEALIRFQEIGSPAIRIGDQLFRDRHIYLSDANVFDVFHFPLLHGNPAALRQACSAAPLALKTTLRGLLHYHLGHQPLRTRALMVDVQQLLES